MPFPGDEFSHNYGTPRLPDDLWVRVFVFEAPEDHPDFEQSVPVIAYFVD
jgi:hypothetical protein